VYIRGVSAASPHPATTPLLSRACCLGELGTDMCNRTRVLVCEARGGGGGGARGPRVVVSPRERSHVRAHGSGRHLAAAGGATARESGPGGQRFDRWRGRAAP